MFLNCLVPKGINSSFVYLIPEVSKSTAPSDFRPISCCNVTYKCMAKVITNRLEVVIEGLVDKSQVAFIPNRDIPDKLLLAHSLVRSYSQKRVSPRCTIKIDIQKAYDMVSWEVITLFLKEFGFSEKLIDWACMCVHSLRYSIIINGSLFGYFPGLKGLRHIFPYLFI